MRPHVPFNLGGLPSIQARVIRLHVSDQLSGESLFNLSRVIFHTNQNSFATVIKGMILLMDYEGYTFVFFIKK